MMPMHDVISLRQRTSHSDEKLYLSSEEIQL